MPRHDLLDYWTEAPRKAARKSEQAIPKKYDKLRSLHPMNFVDAVDKLLRTKAAKRTTKKKSRFGSQSH
jgi:hypothetical protein